MNISVFGAGLVLSMMNYESRIKYIKPLTQKRGKKGKKKKREKKMFSIDAKSQYLSPFVLLQKENMKTDEAAQLPISLSFVCVCTHNKLASIYLFCIYQWNEMRLHLLKIYIYSPSFLTDANSSRRTLHLMLFQCSSDLLFLCADIHLSLKLLTSNVQLCYILSCCACHSFTI